MAKIVHTLERVTSVFIFKNSDNSVGFCRTNIPLDKICDINVGGWKSWKLRTVGYLLLSIAILSIVANLSRGEMTPDDWMGVIFGGGFWAVAGLFVLYISKGWQVTVDTASNSYRVQLVGPKAYEKAIKAKHDITDLIDEQSSSPE